MADMNVQLRLQVRDEMSGQAVKALQETANAANATRKASQGLEKATSSLDRVRLDGLLSALKRVQAQGKTALQTLTRLGSAAGSALQRAGNTAVSLGSGAVAGGYVASRALAPAISYESRMASMANVAFNDRDATGRIAGMKELDAAVMNATNIGGGSRDQAADALNTMLAMGMDSGTATRLLPQLQKAATASDADVNELAQVVMKGMEQGFFSEAQVGEAIDKAVKAGEAGQFELKDMARWLPQLMANAKGMKGMEGYESILASLQGISVVTGTNDQAGNALFNLLGKVTSQDTVLDFKKQGIDLTGYLASASEQGQLPLDAFVSLIETEIIGKDKRYQDIQAKMATANGAEQKALVEQTADLLQGSAIGTVVQDREAGLALAAMLTQKATIQNVQGELGNASGAVDTSFAVKASTSEYTLQKAQNEMENARSRMFSDVKPLLDSAVSGLTGLASEFPKLSTVVMEVTTAFAALGAASAAMNGVGMMMGGASGKSGGATPRDSKGRFMQATAGQKAKAGLRSGAKLGGVMAIVGAGLNIASTESSDMSRDEKNAAHVGTAGGALGATAGAAIGGALGSVIPVAGTAIGATLGSVAGGWIGDFLGQKLGDMIFKDESTVHVESVLQLDGREVARTVNEVNGRNASRQ